LTYWGSGSYQKWIFGRFLKSEVLKNKRWQNWSWWEKINFFDQKNIKNEFSSWFDVYLHECSFILAYCGSGSNQKWIFGRFLKSEVLKNKRWWKCSWWEKINFFDQKILQNEFSSWFDVYLQECSFILAYCGSGSNQKWIFDRFLKSNVLKNKGCWNWSWWEKNQFFLTRKKQKQIEFVIWCLSARMQLYFDVLWVRILPEMDFWQIFKV